MATAKKKQSVQTMRGAKYRPSWSSAEPSYALRTGATPGEEAAIAAQLIQERARRSRELWEWQTNHITPPAPVRRVSKRRAKAERERREGR